MRVRHWLLARADESPRAEALVTEGTRLSWAELAERSVGVARVLWGAGVRPGERVALLLPGGLDFVSAFHAVPLCGATVVPLDTRFTPGEIAWQLRTARVTHLVHPGGALADRADVARRALDALEVRGLCLPGGPPAPDACLRTDLELEDTLAILFTSGTTGRPKGARLSAANFLWSAWSSMLRLGFRREDRWLACLPLFHVGGLAILVRSAMAGNPVVVHAGFDPERVVHDLAAERIALASFVPTMLERLLRQQNGRSLPRGLRAALLGGAAARPALLADARRAGVPVLPTYGLTEAASQVATASPDEAAPPDGVVGRPLFGTEVRIVDPDGRVLGPEQEGEIVVRGPTVMQGYIGDAESTRRILRDGWLHTGDVGRLDAQGRLVPIDRRDDLVVSGGENVYPAEVEAALLGHPDVVEVGVAGVPDADLGRRVTAWVVPREGSEPRAEALRRFCRTRLAGYKVPKEIRFVGALPRTASGKLERRRLVEE